MPKFTTTQQDFVKISKEGKTVNALSSAKLDKFNSSLLGLGDISAVSRPISCVAAVFDLQGFTNFCKQIDPELSVPAFLNEFLGWIFSQIKEEQIDYQDDKGAVLYAPLPFYAKFLGDGLLFLWDTNNTHPTVIRNTMAICESICHHYSESLYPQLKKRLVEPPSLLRCGLARGTVFSVGDGNDYVGSCINMAARLQKLGSTLTFAFNCRGVQFDDKFNDQFTEPMSVKRTEIRGIGSGELIAVRDAEFALLPDEEKRKFASV